MSDRRPDGRNRAGALLRYWRFSVAPEGGQTQTSRILGRSTPEFLEKLESGYYTPNEQEREAIAKLTEGYVPTWLWDLPASEPCNPQERRKQIVRLYLELARELGQSPNRDDWHYGEVSWARARREFETFEHEGGVDFRLKTELRAAWAMILMWRELREQHDKPTVDYYSRTEIDWIRALRGEQYERPSLRHMQYNPRFGIMQFNSKERKWHKVEDSAYHKRDRQEQRKVKRKPRKTTKCE